MSTSEPSAARLRVGYIILFTTTALGIALLVVIAGTLSAYALFLKQYNNRIAPGVTVAGQLLTGMTYLEAMDALEQRAAVLNERTLQVEYTYDKGVATINIPSIQLPSDAVSTEIELYAVDVQRALDSAYAVGRSGTVAANAKDQLAALLWGREFPIDYRFNREVIAGILKEQLKQYETASVNATLSIDDQSNVTIVPEQPGTTFDFDAMLSSVESQVRSLSSDPVVVSLTVEEPRVTAAGIRDHQATVEEYLSRSPVTLTWEDLSWSLDRIAIGQMLSFKKKEVYIDSNALATALRDAAETINVEATEARWKVLTQEATGVLIGLEPMTDPVEGRGIDYEATAERLLDALRNGESQPRIEITVQLTPPKFTREMANDLGIKDILGTGHSNMGGSPVNRRANISRGVELLNGLIIAPQEEFSLLSALKPFTVENGYVPELVIRGNETVPEIGGGLCQIGTTLFRAVMGAGLKILKRQAHSYAVSYYADDRNRMPGTDATIYDPAPDFVFVNDTPGYIVLQTRIEGNDLYFDFWGTDDGRVGSFSEPIAYNWVDPPPLKEVETDSLAPGERKCTETAHRGVSAEFTYTVVYADGSKTEELYKSVYKPWQAVCLIGKQPETTTTPPVSDDAVPAGAVDINDSSDATLDNTTNDASKKPKKKNGSTTANSNTSS